MHSFTVKMCFHFKNNKLKNVKLLTETLFLFNKFPENKENFYCMYFFLILTFAQNFQALLICLRIGKNLSFTSTTFSCLTSSGSTWWTPSSWRPSTSRRPGSGTRPSLTSPLADSKSPELNSSTSKYDIHFEVISPLAIWKLFYVSTVCL